MRVGARYTTTGALSYSDRQGRIGATTAIDDINAPRGIKTPGGGPRTA